MGQGNSYLDMHDNWWKAPDVVKLFFQEFKQYLLGLLLSGFLGPPYYEFFTGFLFRHREHLFWMTAGHIIDSIEDKLINKDNKLIMRWFDGYSYEQAGSIPINLKSIKLKSWSPINLDAGVIKIGYLEEKYLLMNDSIRPLNEQICMYNERAKPEGYYIIGFPRKYNNYHEEAVHNNKVLKSLRADYACIPVKKLNIPNDDPNLEFFENPDTFYGQLLDQQLDPNNYLDDIKYLSGSPIFSIERTQENKFLYRLFGIQKKWLPTTRRICAEPMTKIINELNSWMDENFINEQF